MVMGGSGRAWAAEGMGWKAVEEWVRSQAVEGVEVGAFGLYGRWKQSFTVEEVGKGDSG